MRRDARDALRRAAPLAECNACGSPIRFVRMTATGKALPVNPLTNTKGNVAARIVGGVLVGFVISRDHRPGPLDPLRFLAHQASCEARTTPSTTPTPAADEPLF